MIVLVPSRGRPESIAELFHAFDDTCSLDSTALVVAVDDDDPRIEDYRALPLSPNRFMAWGPSSRLVRWLNHLSSEMSGNRIIGFCGDDHRPRTKGWDEAITLTLETMGTGIAYGNDLIQGPNLPTAVFMTSDIIRTLGYMVPPSLVHFYADNAWKAWGEGMGRLAYMPEVIIEHLHPIAGKGQTDEHYERSWALMGADGEAWEHYIGTGGLAADIEKLKALL